jgi:hypothetical protein
MEFIQPLMLWGTGAVIIPVVIHFWHQKRGQTLAWAATRWLQEQNQQQQRGIKLDKLPLLIIRCLVVILLAVLLSQPLFKWLTKSPVIQKIHLVQPEKFVVDNFRFELEEAIKKGEPIYWINAGTESSENPLQLPDRRAFNTNLLQSSINKLRQDHSELHLYLINNPQLADAPFIRVPTKYKLHPIVDSASQPVRAYLELPGSKKVFVNQSNQLTSNAVLDQKDRFQTGPAHTGNLAVLVDCPNRTEQQTVLAALNALSEVYSLHLLIDIKANPGRKYDWIITNQDVVNPEPQTLYVVSGKLKIPTVSNVIYTAEKLAPQTAEMVRAGQLPEWRSVLVPGSPVFRRLLRD